MAKVNPKITVRTTEELDRLMEILLPSGPPLEDTLNSDKFKARKKIIDDSDIHLINFKSML